MLGATYGSLSVVVQAAVAAIGVGFVVSSGYRQGRFS